MKFIIDHFCKGGDEIYVHIRYLPDMVLMEKKFHEVRIVLKTLLCFCVMMVSVGSFAQEIASDDRVTTQK